MEVGGFPLGRPAPSESTTANSKIIICSKRAEINFHQKQHFPSPRTDSLSRIECESGVRVGRNLATFPPPAHGGMFGVPDRCLHDRTFVFPTTAGGRQNSTFCNISSTLRGVSANGFIKKMKIIKFAIVECGSKVDHFCTFLRCPGPIFPAQLDAAKTRPLESRRSLAK
ncbi:hypothetical protein ZHAS_00006411 [Anopheles sinensis]|uniref:Uncharacterized protein n=1 Tax=Anopheles sinensis TaxID=74873 RepID=A0A084VM92_ANOSI|nr:hypothetical protein ZHAS_00006411 [Anopheles sinensis]